MPDQESIVLEVDPRSVLTAIKQANQAVEGWEKGTVGAGERMQKLLDGRNAAQGERALAQFHGAAHAVHREASRRLREDRG